MAMSKLNVAVIGASGAIGSALVTQFANRDDTDKIFTLSRSDCAITAGNVIPLNVDLESEASIQTAADAASQDAPLDQIIVATGFLHDENIMPEKSLKDLSTGKFEKLFAINSIGPALLAKHFLPTLTRQRRSVFAAISARVGSISDNSLGGWYAYRASKAALNMIIKCASIEMARRNPAAIVVALHPGTVDSSLSRPFHRHVPESQLFSPSQAAGKLLSLIDRLEANDSGKFFAWDGKQIPF